MRGWDVRSDALFSYVSCEARVPKDHPLRAIRRIVDEALAALSPEFEKLYARFGRNRSMVRRPMKSAGVTGGRSSVRRLSSKLRQRVGCARMQTLVRGRTLAGV